MVSTVEICESNGSTETITHNISNMNYGITDSPNITIGPDEAIPVGEHSMSKAQRLHVSVWGSNLINNLKVYKYSGDYLTGESIKCNLHEVQASYDVYKETTYTQGSRTAISATYNMPTSLPTNPNLGIGGSLSGSFTGTGYSDYMRSQLQTTGSTPQGNANQKVIRWMYDEQ